MTRIVFSDLKVGKISNSSGIFTGENVQTNQRCSKKINEGFGNISSDGVEAKGSINVVNDKSIPTKFLKPYIKRKD